LTRHEAPSHLSKSHLMDKSMNIGCLRRANRLFCSLISILIVVIFTTTGALAQRRVDDPDDQEDLNRELWEFARHTPYDSILAYVKDAQRASRTTQSAEVE